jgi:hypothetical protein
MSAVDLTPVIITDLAQLPRRPLREIGPDQLTPLEGRTYVYCQMVPDLTDASTDDINQKRRVPHLNGKGEPYIKRFVEKTNGIP